jgi:hypothetical protein
MKVEIGLRMQIRRRFLRINAHTCLVSRFMATVDAMVRIEQKGVAK